jgi:aryl-alcohol dehydrogenase
MQMKAAVARVKSAPLSIETLEIEDPRPGEILVRVHATGICHTDLAMRDQVFPVPMPIVLGHEGAGVIEKLGPGVENLAVGDHVVMSFNSCGQCPCCLEGVAGYCEKFMPLNFGGSRMDGSTPLRKNGEVVHGNFFGQSSFAEYAICNVHNAVRVPKELAFELLAPLGCGIITGAGAVMNAFRLQPGQSIAVFGVGSVGLSAIMAARASGASAIIAVDVLESRLQLAKELGATDVVNGSQSNSEEAIKAIVPSGVRYALDTTGRPSVIQTAVACLSGHGVCGFLGVSAPTETLAFNLIDAISLGKSARGIVEGDCIPQAFIPKLIDLNRRGLFPYDKLIRCYPFDKINEAIHDSETGKVVKAVVRM